MPVKKSTGTPTAGGVIPVPRRVTWTSETLLFSVRISECSPGLSGRKSIGIDTLSPGAMTNMGLVVGGKIVKVGSPPCMASISRARLPVLTTTRTRSEDCPTSISPNSTEEFRSVSSGAARPVPVRVTLTVLREGSLDAISRVPIAGPGKDGRKLSLTVELSPGEMVMVPDGPKTGCCRM